MKEEQLAIVANSGLHYEESGDKSAAIMLFLHGGGVGGWMWDTHVSHFSHFHCLVPNLLNPRNVPFSIQTSAAQLIRLIEEKGQGKEVIVVGFSLGAQVAIQLVSMRPDLIHYAVIHSALVRPNLLMAKMIKPMIRLTYPLIHNRKFAKMQAKSLFIRDDQFDVYFDESRQITRESLVDVLEENMKFSLPSSFSAATCKMLVTVGEKEKAVMRKSAKDIVEANENCTGTELPNIGHGLPLIDLQQSTRLIDVFLQEPISRNVLENVFGVEGREYKLNQG